MFKINMHLQGKAAAKYPDDFPLLTEGKRFVMYPDGNGYVIQTTETGEELKQLIEAELKLLN